MSYFFFFLELWDSQPTKNPEHLNGGACSYLSFLSVHLVSLFILNVLCLGGLTVIVYSIRGLFCICVS